MSPLFLMKDNFRPSKLFLSRQTFPSSVPHKVFFGFEIWTETERENVSLSPDPEKEKEKEIRVSPFSFPPPFFHRPFPLLRSPSAASRDIPHCTPSLIVEEILPSYLRPSTMPKGQWGRPFKKNYTWSQMTEEVMLDLMIESITNGVGKGTDGKIRAETYAYVVENFNEKMGSSITKLNIDSRMKTWRKQYKGITTLREQKGFLWDDKFHRVEADYEVWREFIKKNDWAASFREKSFPLYDKLAILFVNSSDIEAMEARFEDNAEALLTQIDSSGPGVDAVTKQDYPPLDTVDPGRNVTELQAMPSRRRCRLSPITTHDPTLPLRQRQRFCSPPEQPEFMSNYVREVTNSITRYLDEVKEVVIRKLEVIQKIEDKRLQKLSELEEQRIQLLAEIEAMKTQRVAEAVQASRPLDLGECRPQKVTEMEDKQIPKATQKMNDDNCDEAYEYLMEIQDLDDETIYASLQLLENKEKRKQFILLPHEKRIGWLMWTISNKKPNGSL